MGKTKEMCELSNGEKDVNKTLKKTTADFMEQRDFLEGGGIVGLHQCITYKQRRTGLLAVGLVIGVGAPFNSSMKKSNI